VSQDWNVGTQRVNSLKKEDEKAVLIGLVFQQQTDEKVQEYLDELEFLALTAGAVTTKRFVQKLERPDTRFFVGKGKLEEIARYVDANDIDLAIFDDDLTGKQQNLIEEALKIKVVDRSTLILDIFASRAQSAQAKTQVELAQLQYLLPRLRGMWTHLERQRGGIGMRGPGEKEIETDRRIVRDIISGLKKDLEKIERQAQTQRKTRGEMIRVALVGYTNVGKSTLMNLISKSEVFAENKLFATLDTTVRKVVFGKMPFLLSDTVGFIRKLPHHLVESFKSTLDEVRESDILLHVVDFAHPQYEDHIATVNQTLQDINCRDKPTLLVFNKMDLYRERNFDQLLDSETKADIEKEILENLSNKYDTSTILISAQTGENIPELKDKIAEMVEKQYMIRYPYRNNKW
jgi:GTP-binding protein HflX